MTRGLRDEAAECRPQCNGRPEVFPHSYLISTTPSVAGYEELALPVEWLDS
jgi:hypothetical protein